MFRRCPIEEEREKNKLFSYVEGDFEKKNYVSVVRRYETLQEDYHIYHYETEKIKKNLRKIANYYLDECKFPDNETLITLGELLLGDDWNSIREDSELAYRLFSMRLTDNLSRTHELWISYFAEQSLNFDDDS
ncbi:MAG: hypothetical protein V1788_02245 [Nanoarchaeota archaeon]|nr:hypothetical protein [Nanoarchaeota archaeon]